MDALNNQVGLDNICLRIYLVDDASTDGTSEAVIAKFPEVEILQGDGGLYWCGGTRLAWDKAMKYTNDFYLWLNDDTILFPKALYSIFNAIKKVGSESAGKGIFVGSTKNKEGQLNYGGNVSISKLRRLAFVKVWSETAVIECDAINGNCVLVSEAVAHVIGNIDRKFIHGMGDFDYSLRAKKYGFKNYVVPGFIGYCPDNSISNTYKDKRPNKSSMSSCKSKPR